MKFPKKFEKKSSWSKKFFWHRKLNDGSPGYWEKSCLVNNLLLRFLKLHLKIFLKASFSSTAGVCQIFKKFLSPNALEYRPETCTYERSYVWLHIVWKFLWCNERLIFQEGGSLPGRTYCTCSVTALKRMSAVPGVTQGRAGLLGHIFIRNLRSSQPCFYFNFYYIRKLIT